MIQSATRRSRHDLFLYFIYITDKEVGLNWLKTYHYVESNNWYKTGTLPTYLPKVTVTDLHDIAWELGRTAASQPSGGASIIAGMCAHYQLNKRPIEHWIGLFQNGEDLIDQVFDQVKDYYERRSIAISRANGRNEISYSADYVHDCSPKDGQES